jgi:hypothetical protein
MREYNNLYITIGGNPSPGFAPRTSILADISGFSYDSDRALAGCLRLLRESINSSIERPKTAAIPRYEV